MLADPRAEALTTNFAGQWLYLRNLKNMQPNSEQFPDFDDNLRQAFEREASLFFDSIVREDRNVLDLMTADYTFVNERLAKHYGIPNVYGSQFRRVTLARRHQARAARQGRRPDGHVAHRSHVAGGPRQVDPRQSARRAAAGAAGECAAAQREPGARRPGPEHARADGRASRQSGLRQLPQADGSDRPLARELRRGRRVAGARRRSVTEQGTPIDANGQLLDGTKVDGVVTLRQALLKQPEIFVSTVTEKLLTYALGRGLQPLRHARGPRHRRRRRPAPDTVFRRLCWESSTARRFRSESRRSSQPAAWRPAERGMRQRLKRQPSAFIR